MSIPGYLVRALLCGSTALAAFGTLSAVQGSSQSIRLTDPTPRQPDLEQKYNHPTASGPATDHAAILLNQQRHALVAKAANQLASLAATLKSSILRHQENTSLAPEVQIADLIEKLAKNVNEAVKLDGRPSQPHSAKTTEAPSVETPAAQLRQGAEQLVIAVQQLQAEVGKTNQETLSLGVVTTSAEVERVARNLKQQMKKRANS